MLNNIYREALLNHPYGYALYEPQSSKVVKPGVCGYIDPENGHFVPLVGAEGKIVDLGDAHSLRSSGLSQLESLQRAESDKRSWGPKTSARVQGAKVNLSGNASLIPAGIPAEIGALYEFESSDDFGAILMTRPPVVRHSLYGSTTYRKWCRDNTAVLLAQWPEIQQSGLIIVTSTYVTQQADINAWQDKSKKVSIGFQSSAVDVFEVAPSSEWYKASSDSGWIVSRAENTDEMRVVFFGGLRFKYRTLAPVLPQQYALHQKPLGTLRSTPAADKFNLVYDGAEYEVDSEEIGHGEVIRTPPPELADDEDGEAEF